MDPDSDPEHRVKPSFAYYGTFTFVIKHKLVRDIKYIVKSTHIPPRPFLHPCRLGKISMTNAAFFFFQFYDLFTVDLPFSYSFWFNS